VGIRADQRLWVSAAAASRSFKLSNASPVWHALRSRRADTVRVHRGPLIMRIMKNRDHHRADGPAYC
jgi:hypothetical protein